MKIKTITCHDVYNVGASLQSYALATYLKRLGHDVEIIDYKPEYLRHYRLWGIGNSAYDKPILRQIYQVLKLPERIVRRHEKRKKEFDKFTKEYLPLTKRCYYSFDELKSRPPIADVVFAGSDQIWNTLFHNGKDPAFYLQFMSNDCVKASYAASFATEEIESSWKEKVKDWISLLDFVSVREKTALTILEDLGIVNGIQVMDPVFLLAKDVWQEFVGNDFIEPYVLIYDFDTNQDLADFARQIAKKNGWKVYSFLKNPYADRCFGQEGPQMFLSLINNAEIVISNSFHATAFSIIFRKNFFVFKRQEKINVRMVDLLRELGLQKRLTDGKNNGEILEINYEQVSIEKTIENSKRYIDMVLAKGKTHD